MKTLSREREGVTISKLKALKASQGLQSREVWNQCASGSITPFLRSWMMSATTYTF